MKSFSEYKNEQKSRSIRESADQYTLFPKNKKELKQMIKEEIKIQGPRADLNHIDVSGITDFSELFLSSKKFNGDISKWDVSNATNMHAMFMRSSFRNDISEWDVSNVTDMSSMFFESQFNGDISG